MKNKLEKPNLENSFINRLNPLKGALGGPKKALMQKAMQQLATMKAKDMFKMFQTKILPIFEVNSKVELKATKILLNDGKTWYAVLFRDVE